MSGSLIVNGQKIARQLSAIDALPGFLIVVVPPDAERATTKSGDLILKTSDDIYFRIHENPSPVDWSDCEKDIIVQYADITLTFTPVKDE